MEKRGDRAAAWKRRHAVKSDPSEDDVHKHALDLLRGPYLLATSRERLGDGKPHVPAREPSEPGRDGTDEKRRRSGRDGAAE